MFWFVEKPLPQEKKGERIFLLIKKKIFSGKSPFQEIEVLDSKSYGRILVLDGILQLTQKDEFIFHEMVGNLPLFSHPNPKNVLIIGGGDGGVLREVLKHKIKTAYLCEIDPKVVEVSKKYLKFCHQNSFFDKRTKIFFQDGKDFVKKFKNYFEVIILDITDPGTVLGKNLLTKKFTLSLISALKDRGVLAVQTGGIESSLRWIKKLYFLYQSLFNSVKIYRFHVPSFFEIEWSLLMAGKNINLEKISLKLLRKRFKKIKTNFKYYSPEIHYFSGILPPYLKRKLKITN